MNEAMTGFLTDDALVSRLAICPDLPSPPGVALQIVQLGENPEIDIGEIARLVSLDPALSAKILRIANSPIYSRMRRVENLRQAILTFGLNGTRIYALSFALVDALRASSGAGVDHNLFWRRSLAAAIACRHLSEQALAGTPEEYFLVGLLQDIGMLALDQIMPELYYGQRGVQPDHSALREVEQATLGTDHTAVGAWLLASWRLPERWAWALAASHCPDTMEIAEDYLPLARCVALAGDIADTWCGNDPGSALQRAKERASDWFGIDHPALALIVETMAQQIQATATVFDIDLGDRVLTESLLSRARELMMVRNIRVLRAAENLNRTARQLESRAEDLERQARLDGLTGLYNRRHLDEALEREFTYATEQGWPLTLVLVDLDHFKQVNDTYGHQVGDEVLRQAAVLLASCARDTDIVARYGGEEFVLLLPGTGLRGARIVCDRMVNAFRDTSHRVGDDQQVTVTVSIGLTVHGESSKFNSTHAFLRAADMALYAAKAEGRDRVVCYSEKLSHFA
jgi:diguanylate cyclase (GGDEF)-like protein